MSRSAIEDAVTLRGDRPLAQDDLGTGVVGRQFGNTRLGLGGQPRSYLLRATAELTNGQAKRTVAALVEIGGAGPDPVHVVRWYDIAF